MCNCCFDIFQKLKAEMQNVKSTVKRTKNVEMNGKDHLRKTGRVKEKTGAFKQLVP